MRRVVAGSEDQPDKSFELRVPGFELVSTWVELDFKTGCARWAKHTLRLILKSIVNRESKIAKGQGPRAKSQERRNEGSCGSMSLTSSAVTRDARPPLTRRSPTRINARLPACVAN